jgi:hypothetical protein
MLPKGASYERYMRSAMISQKFCNPGFATRVSFDDNNYLHGSDL